MIDHLEKKNTANRETRYLRGINITIYEEFEFGWWSKSMKITNESYIMEDQCACHSCR